MYIILIITSSIRNFDNFIILQNPNQSVIYITSDSHNPHMHKPNSVMRRKKNRYFSSRKNAELLVLIALKSDAQANYC